MPTSWNVELYQEAYESGLRDQDPTTFELAPPDEATFTHYAGFDWKDRLSHWITQKQAGTHPPLPPVAHNIGPYRPLLDPFEIRILDLHPGSLKKPLRGSLRHCSLEFPCDPVHYDKTGVVQQWHKHGVSIVEPIIPVTYTALSYTWGPPKFVADIECDGKRIAITQTLEEALWNLRDPERTVTLWVDQICINQMDNYEKAVQVPLMGRIYDHAWSTIIWLGNAESGSTSALQLLHDLNRVLSMLTGEIGPDDFERIGLPAPISTIWNDLYKMLSRPYFTRLWIIQELVVSRKIWVACGTDRVSWDEFGDACLLLAGSSIPEWFCQQSTSTRDLSVFQLLARLRLLKSAYKGSNNSNTLFYNLVETRSAKCYETRDKVYGLLAMTRPSIAEAVTVSYAKDFNVVDLFCSVVRDHLQLDSGGLRLTSVLSSVDHEASDLPSWIPDWTKIRQTDSLGYYSSGQHVYGANGTGRFRPVFEKANCSFDVGNPRELLVMGVSLDTIARLSDTFEKPIMEYTNIIDGRCDTLLQLHDFASYLNECPNSDSVFTAFWKTLVAGRDSTGKQRCPESYAEVVSLLLDKFVPQSPALPGQTYSKRQRLAEGRGRLDLMSLDKRTLGLVFKDFRLAFRQALTNRRLCVTSKGYLGLVPRHTRIGEEIFVFDGCHVPFVLRRLDVPYRYQLVGECYIHGIMHGEVVANDDVEMQEVRLV